MQTETAYGTIKLKDYEIMSDGVVLEDGNVKSFSFQLVHSQTEEVSK